MFFKKKYLYYVILHSNSIYIYIYIVVLEDVMWGFLFFYSPFYDLTEVMGYKKFSVTF